MREWSIEDNLAAEREGWAIFNRNSVPEIQRIDDMELFTSDETAWEFVLDLALAGSEFHRRALLIIKEENEDDWRWMVEITPKLSAL